MSADLLTAGVSPPGARAVPIRREPGDAGFDRWLQRELSRLYDQTLSEPVPEDLLRLLQDGDAKGRG